MRAIAQRSPETRVELLIPDFMGVLEHVDTVLDAGPHIVAHNTETIPRLYRRVRPNAIYRRSLDVIQRISSAGVVSKTGLMMGLGETDEEVEAVMYDLREVGCEILTLGQYLSPTSRHLAVDRWVSPKASNALPKWVEPWDLDTSNQVQWCVLATWLTVPLSLKWRRK